MDRVLGANFGQINVSRLSAWCVLFIIATAGIKWIPLASIGGFSIEMHNAASLLGFGMAVVWVLLKQQLIIPKEYLLLFTAIVLMVFLSILRGANVSNNIVLSMPALLGSLLVVYTANFSFLKSKYTYGFLLLSLSLIISARISGQDLFSGLASYLTSFDRNEFIYRVLRPIFNAFSTSNEEELIYGGPLVNHLASGFYLFFVLSCANIVAKSSNFLDWVIAGLSFFMIFALFSSTVLFATFLTAVFAGFFIVRRARGFIAISAIFVTMLFVVPLSLPYLSSYLLFGFGNETSSVDTRMSQNIAALDSITYNILSGGGSVSSGGHGLHNLPLFAWTEGGILAFFSIVGFYFLSISAIVQGLKNLLAKETNYHYEAFLLATLPIFVILRSFFGGGGGMPAAAEATALALIVVAKQSLPKRAPKRRIKFI